MPVSVKVSIRSVTIAALPVRIARNRSPSGTDAQALVPRVVARA